MRKTKKLGRKLTEKLTAQKLAAELELDPTIPLKTAKVPVFPGTVTISFRGIDTLTGVQCWSIKIAHQRDACVRLFILPSLR